MKLTPIPFVLLAFLSLAACKSRKAVVQEKPAKSIENERVRLQFDQAFFNAERQKVLGNYDEAIEALKEALEIYPQSASAHYEMADIYFSQERLNQAYQSIQEAIKLEQENLYFYDLKAQICHALKKHTEAAEALKEVIRLQPGNPDAYFDAANEYIYAKKYNDALDIYDRMEERFGVGEEVILQKEKIYLQLGKPDKAIAEVKKLIKLAPTDSRYQGILAEIYMSSGKMKEAVAIYQEILKTEPENGFAHFGMAEYYRSQNKKEEMFSELNLAFRDSRINIENKINILFNLLPLLERDPSLKKPLFDMAETIRDAHPEEAAGYGVLGDLYLADNRKTEAINAYREALKRDPSSFQVWNQYCSLLLEKADFEELEKAAEEGLISFPNQIELYYYKALAAYQNKHYDVCVEAGEGGLALYSTDDSYNAQLYTVLGDAYHNLEKHDKSDEALEKALELNPNNLYVLNNYAYYLSLRKENLEKAKQMSAKTLEAEPNNSSYLDTYGWVLYNLGQYEEAKNFIQRSLNLNNNSAEVLEHMGDVLYKLDQVEEAKNYWRKALQINPESRTLKDKTEGKINL